LRRNSRVRKFRDREGFEKDAPSSLNTGQFDASGATGPTPIEEMKEYLDFVSEQRDHAPATLKSSSMSVYVVSRKNACRLPHRTGYVLEFEDLRDVSNNSCLGSFRATTLERNQRDSGVE